MDEVERIMAEIKDIVVKKNYATGDARTSLVT